MHGVSLVTSLEDLQIPYPSGNRMLCQHFSPGTQVVPDVILSQLRANHLPGAKSTFEELEELGTLTVSEYVHGKSAMEIKTADMPAPEFEESAPSMEREGEVEL